MSAAEINAAPRVLGKKLRPFTLGHQALLEAVGSSFAVGSEYQPKTFEEEYYDLLISVYVCSLDFRAALVAFSFPWLIQAHIWYWKMRVGDFDLFEEVSKFQRYIDQNTEQPRYWIDDNHQTPDSGIPWLQFLKQKNQELLGIDDDRCMELPYKAALDNWLTHLASAGAIKIWTERDYELVGLAKGGK